MTGTGSIGNINPGWSWGMVTFPFIPGARATGTGGVSFSAKKNPDSLFVLNNDANFDIYTNLEYIENTGRITSVNDNGPAVSLTQASKFAIFDTEEIMPPLYAGNPISAFDVAQQVTKENIRLNTGLFAGTLWTLSGHNAGFDNVGDLVRPTVSQADYKWEAAGSTTTTQNIVNYKNSVFSQSFEYYEGPGATYNVYATDAIGENAIDHIKSPYYFVAYKTRLNAFENQFFTLNGGPLSSITNTDREITFTLDEDTQTLSLHLEYRSGGVVVAEDYSDSYGFSYNDELHCFFEYNLINNQSVQPEYFLSFTVVQAGDIVNQITTTFIADAIPIYYEPWQITGNLIRHVWINSDSSVIDPSTGALVEPSDWDKSIDWVSESRYYIPSSLFADPNAVTQVFPGGAVVGGKYNVWQYLQDACSAFGMSINNLFDSPSFTSGYDFDFSNIIDNTFVSDTKRIIDGRNFAASPSVTPSTVLSAESVNVEYTNPEYKLTVDINSTLCDEVYSAYDDNNRTISVEANQVISTTVKTNNYFITAYQPIKSSIYVNQPGYYAVSDSTGANVTDAAWAAYGGSVSVTINEEDNSALDIKVTGPTLAIPGKTAPYSIAYSNGSDKYAALSVTGIAVSTDKKSIEIQTGVVEKNKKQQTAATISNKFIDTIEKAYDRGIWVAHSIAGPSVAMSFALPQNHSLVSNNLYDGRIKYNDSIYRINTCAVTSPSIAYNAEWCVGLDDFDGEWSSHTVEFHDDLWGQYDIQDQIMAPLLGIEKVGMYLSTDTDLNPTWVFEQFGEATMLLDDDSNPYIEVVGSDEDNTLLYLDSDFTPYYV